MPTDKERVKFIIEDNDFLNSQNANYRSYCQDLADFALPRKAWINSMRFKGERIRFGFLYDSTAIIAARTTAHGIHSNLTNETLRWFALESVDPDDMQRQDVKLWFKEVEDQMYMRLRGSNFYNVILEDYLNKIVFGTNTFSMLDDEKDFVKFKNFRTDQVNRVVDDNGRLMEIYVNFKLTARQAFKLFGDNAGKSVMESLEKKPHEFFEFLHFVGERFDRDPRYADSTNLPFKSCWINIKDQHLISESGFFEMPYISDVFYSDTNDPNGFSPMMDVLPWVKLLNAMARTVIRAGMKVTDPPVTLPSRGFVLPLNFNPAAINYRDAKTPNDALQILQHGGRVDIGMDLMNQVRDSINEGLFVPLFQTLNNITKQLSIVETQQLIAQNMSILGPVIGRFDFGTLSPTIFRLFGMLQRAQELPIPPEVLQGKGFRVVYLGPLAKAQRQADIAEVQSFLADISNIGQIKPNVFDNVNEDKVAKHIHRLRGVTPDILNDEDEIERVREQRAQQEQLAASMQMGQGAADIAKTAAEAQQ